MASVAGPSKKFNQHDTDGMSTLPEISLSLLSSEDYESTSTLHYVNSQLVAHGFARSPGLSLDGLANNDSEKLAKCLLGMLGQRVEDLGRTEELGSKLRTLTYEHERLQSMHGTAVDSGANAEREMHLFKSKLAAAQRALTSETTAHKQTLAELQRTRTSLQYLRSTTQNELKRKEKDVERVLERWNKVADSQVKLVGAQRGLHCANLATRVEEHVHAHLRGKGLMEEALEQAEEARGELVKESGAFRSVILSMANALQGMVYSVKCLGADTHIEEPTPLSHTALFAPPTSSLAHPENAHTKIRELLSTVQDAISDLSLSNASTVVGKTPETEEEIAKLKDLVTSLRNELDKSRQSSTTLAAQVQATFDRFTTHASERFRTGRDPTPAEAAEMSMELIGVPERDELRERLNRRSQELERERERFTEASVRFGKEKAALEVERVRLMEEKRRWAVEQMLAELPPTPGPDPDLVSPSRPNKTKVSSSPSPPRVGPRKASAARIVALKSPSKRAAAVRRTPDGHAPGKRVKMRRESAIFEEVEVRYEPEAGQNEPTKTATATNGVQLHRSTTPEDSPLVTAPAPTTGTGAGNVAAEMKTSLPLVLPTTFTLPPPSPASSLTAAALDLGPITLNPNPTPNPSSSVMSSSSSTVPSFDAIPLATAPVAPLPVPRARTFPSPRTPRGLVAAHVQKKHAYSPARPSPLSRILMIAESPPSPPEPAMLPVLEEEETEDENGGGVSLASAAAAPAAAPAVPPKRNLVREFRLEVPIDEPSPLRERVGARNIGVGWGAGTGNSKDGLPKEKEGGGEGGEKRFTAKEKGKGRAVPAPTTQGVRARVTSAEKENVNVAVGTGVRPGAASRKSSTVVSSSRNGNSIARAKDTRPSGVEAKNAGVGGTVKTSVKASSALRTRSEPTRPPSQVGTGAGNVGAAGTAIRPGGAKRVPVGSVNGGKVGARRV